MNTSLKVLVGLSGVLTMTTAVQAALLVPVPPFPGATTTTVFGIADDNNTIVGSYVDSNGVSHGFTGTLDGNYTSFDYPGADSTQPRAIQGNGKSITGFSNITGDHCSFIEWERDKHGAMTQISMGGTPLNGIAQGMNPKGEFAGDYCDTGGSGTIFGMLGKKNEWKEDVSTPFTSPYTGERGVNGKGTIVGFYVDPDTVLQIGTVIDGGVTSQVIYPDANESYTVLEGINASGEASGQWGDTGGIVHSFAYNVKKATFTEIDDPLAASFTQAWGVNNSGLIAVTSDAGPYIYCPKKKNCPSNPNAGSIALQEHVTHVSPAKLLAYGDGRKTATRHKVNLKLPKGASMQ